MVQERLFDPLDKRWRRRAGAAVGGGEDSGDEATKDTVQRLVILPALDAAASGLDLDRTTDIGQAVSLRHCFLPLESAAVEWRGGRKKGVCGFV